MATKPTVKHYGYTGSAHGYYVEMFHYVGDYPLWSRTGAMHVYPHQAQAAARRMAKDGHMLRVMTQFYDLVSTYNCVLEPGKWVPTKT